MTTLHMDTEVARQTATALRGLEESLRGEVSQMKGRVNNLVSSHWQGNSATQFDGEFQDWMGKANLEFGELIELAQRLDDEISNWETAAQSLGG